MTRHVCPYCETIHMEPKYLPMEFDEETYELAGFGCPNCGCEIVFADEVNRFLRSLSIKEKPPSYLR